MKSGNTQAVLISREPYLPLVTRRDDTRKHQSGSSQCDPRKTLRHPPARLSRRRQLARSRRMSCRIVSLVASPCRVTLSVGPQQLVNERAGQCLRDQIHQAGVVLRDLKAEVVRRLNAEQRQRDEQVLKCGRENKIEIREPVGFTFPKGQFETNVAHSRSSRSRARRLTPHSSLIPIPVLSLLSEPNTSSRSTSQDGQHTIGAARCPGCRRGWHTVVAVEADWRVRRRSSAPSRYVARSVRFSDVPHPRSDLPTSQPPSTHAPTPHPHLPSVFQPNLAIRSRRITTPTQVTRTARPE